jgi:hypothetical protein
MMHHAASALRNAVCGQDLTSWSGETPHLTSLTAPYNDGHLQDYRAVWREMLGAD